MKPEYPYTGCKLIMSPFMAEIRPEWTKGHELDIVEGMGRFNTPALKIVDPSGSVWAVSNNWVLNNPQNFYQSVWSCARKGRIYPSR